MFCWSLGCFLIKSSVSSTLFSKQPFTGGILGTFFGVILGFHSHRSKVKLSFPSKSFSLLGMGQAHPNRDSGFSFLHICAYATHLREHDGDIFSWKRFSVIIWREAEGLKPGKLRKSVKRKSRLSTGQLWFASTHTIVTSVCGESDSGTSQRMPLFCNTPGLQEELRNPCHHLCSSSHKVLLTFSSNREKTHP